MNQLSISEFKKLKVPEILEKAPVELLSDGTVIGTFRAANDATVTVMASTIYQDTGETQCPNCKFKYMLPKKDTTPPYFSIQHG